MIWIMLIYEYIYQNDGFHTVHNAIIASAYSVIKILQLIPTILYVWNHFPFQPPPH